MKYLFKTKDKLKDYNRDNYWIDHNIKDYYIVADNLKEALEKYISSMTNEYRIKVSKSAIKNKRKMYVDSPKEATQVGYVITGEIEIYHEEKHKWVKQYIDLWITIYGIVNVF